MYTQGLSRREASALASVDLPLPLAPQIPIISMVAPSSIIIHIYILTYFKWNYNGNAGNYHTQI